MSSRNTQEVADHQLDPIAYYALESYLFSAVHKRFHHDHCIGSFDFFSIVIWKANRAKSKVAKRLLKNHREVSQDLDTICRAMTTTLYDASTDKQRLGILINDHGFLLPMASAILTVLWPDRFGVYDIRVCDELKKHHRLKNKVHFGGLWDGYLECLDDVRAAAPKDVGLRDADRFLWGRSAAHQLLADLTIGFGHSGP